MPSAPLTGGWSAGVPQPMASALRACGARENARRRSGSPPNCHGRGPAREHGQLAGDPAGFQARGRLGAAVPGDRPPGAGVPEARTARERSCVPSTAHGGHRPTRLGTRATRRPGGVIRGQAMCLVRAFLVECGVLRSRGAAG